MVHYQLFRKQVVERGCIYIYAKMVSEYNRKVSQEITSGERAWETEGQG